MFWRRGPTHVSGQRVGSIFSFDSIVSFVQRVVEGIFILFVDPALQLLHRTEGRFDFVDDHSISKWRALPRRNRQEPKRLILPKHHFPIILLAHIIGHAALPSFFIKIFNSCLILTDVLLQIPTLLLLTR